MSELSGLISRTLALHYLSPSRAGAGWESSNTALPSPRQPQTKASVARKQTARLQPRPRPGSMLCKQQHPRLQHGRQRLPVWCARRKRLLVQAQPPRCQALALPSHWGVIGKGQAGHYRSEGSSTKSRTVVLSPTASAERRRTGTPAHSCHFLNKEFLGFCLHACMKIGILVFWCHFCAIFLVLQYVWEYYEYEIFSYWASWIWNNLK